MFSLINPCVLSFIYVALPFCTIKYHFMLVINKFRVFLKIYNDSKIHMDYNGVMGGMVE